MEKRDRPPSEYYEPAELDRLSAITGIPLEELQDPSPNRDAIARLAGRLDWFFNEFLWREDLQAVHDGKLPADLLVRALQRAIDRSDLMLDLEEEHRRRGSMPG